MAEQSLRGIDELLGFFSRDWFDVRANGRTTVNELLASVTAHFAHNALFFRSPVFGVESEAEINFSAFAEKHKWNDKEKQLARALLAQSLLERGIEFLRANLHRSP